MKTQEGVHPCEQGLGAAASEHDVARHAQFDQPHQGDGQVGNAVASGAANDGTGEAGQIDRRCGDERARLLLLPRLCN
jgi:hypothetical protein